MSADTQRKGRTSRRSAEARIATVPAGASVDWEPGDESHAARILAKVVELVPELRKRALETEKLGHLTPASIADLSKADVFKIAMPVEFGGYALTPTQQHAIYCELARGCGSTAWVAWVTAGGTLWMELYSSAFQNEVFGMKWEGPLNSGVTNSAGPGVASRAPGGFMLKGRWPFCSGCHHTPFHHLGALCTDGDKVEPILCMIPHDQIEILDDWQVMGMQGTGSNTVVIEREVFVPEYRVRRTADILTMTRPGPARAGLIFEVPTLLFATATMTSIGLGSARAAVELLKKKIATRGISNSAYTKQEDAPITHIQLGELHCKLLSAELIAQNTLSRAEAIGRSGKPPDDYDLSRAMLETAYVNKLSSEITEVTLRASGASSIHETSMFQRLFRDSRIPTLHANSNIETWMEHFGRASVGIKTFSVGTRI